MANDGSLKLGVEIDEGSFRSGLSKLGTVAGVALGAATGAAAAFAKTAIDAGMSFDSSMSQVAATMGKTVDEISGLRDAALEAGATTAFSATEAADALNYLALAGYDAETAADTLPAVLNLAAAGGMDLAYASDLATDAMSALGIEAGNENLTKFGDQMAVTASKANTSVAQLGEAILQVGATATMLSGGTTELNAALGILADNGTKGAEGGTRLRNIILSLMAPTDTAAEEMERLGLSVTDAAGNMRPLEDILADLNIAMAGWSDEKRIKTINTIFNKTDIGDVNYLLGVSRDRWMELSSAIDNSEDAMQKMADTQLDNLAGDITMFKSALEGAQIVIADQMNPALREFVQFGTEAVSKLSQAFKDGGLDGAMEALGTILSDGIAMIMEMLPVMIEAGMGLLEALGQGLLENLPAMTDAAVEIVLMLADGIISALPDIAQAAVDLIVTLADGIADALPELIPAIVDANLMIADVLTDPDNLSAIVDAAIEIILALADGLIEALPELIEKAPEIIEHIVQALVDNAPKILEAGAKLIGQLALGLLQALPGLMDAIVEIVDTLYQGFFDLGAGLYDAVSNVFEDLGGFLSESIRGLFGDGLISDILQTFVDGFIGAFEQIYNTISGIFAALGSIFMADLEGAGEAIGDIVSGWADYFQTLLDDIIAVFSDIGSFFTGIGETIVNSITEGISNAWEGLVDWVTGLVEGIVNTIRRIADAIKSLFSFGSGGTSAPSGGASRPRMAARAVSNGAAGNGEEGLSLTASTFSRASAVRALESAMPNIEARVSMATANMAPASGYSGPPPAASGGGGNGGNAQAPVILRPNWTIEFQGDTAQLGRMLNPVIKMEDIRMGTGV